MIKEHIMKSKYPKILSETISEAKAKLTLLVADNVLYFDGHFAHFPLLPGVTQIDWAVFYGQSNLNAGSDFQGMDVVKFQEPITPNSQVILNLEWQQDKQKLLFSYSSEKGVHSSGKITLGNVK